MRQKGKRMEGKAAHLMRLEKKKGYMIFGEIAPNSKLLRESNG